MKIGLKVARFKTDGFRVVSDCFAVLLELRVSNSSPIVCLGVTTIDQDSFGVFFDRFLIVAFSDRLDSLIVISFCRVVWVNNRVRCARSGFGVVSNRLSS